MSWWGDPTAHGSNGRPVSSPAFSPTSISHRFCPTSSARWGHWQYPHPKRPQMPCDTDSRRGSFGPDRPCERLGRLGQRRTRCSTGTSTGPRRLPWPIWGNERQELRVVVDLGESGPTEPAYDFRHLPSQGPTVELLLATCAKYFEDSGTAIDVARVMAWNIRTVLGDALWRSEAGVPLPDGGTPAEWVDALRIRLAVLGLNNSDLI